MKHLKRWFVRKIRKGGRVKIAGHWYTPRRLDAALPYDGRLDGLEARFGMYIDYTNNEYRDFIAYHETIGFEDDYHNDPIWINGVLHWYIWERMDGE